MDRNIKIARELIKLAKELQGTDDNGRDEAMIEKLKGMGFTEKDDYRFSTKMECVVAGIHDVVVAAWVFHTGKNKKSISPYAMIQLSDDYKNLDADKTKELLDSLPKAKTKMDEVNNLMTR